MAKEATTMSTAELVGTMYEAFLRGDVPFLLEQMSESVDWENWDDRNTAQAAGVDYLLHRKGVAGVTEFFQSVAANLEPLDFRVLAIIGDRDEVVARVTTEWRVIPTGKTFIDEELHWWSFDPAGKVVGFRHYVDTAKHIEANTVG